MSSQSSKRSAARTVNPRARDDDRARGSVTLPSRRRLGPVEYALLALIVLSVGVTVMMAIANP